MTAQDFGYGDLLARNAQVHGIRVALVAGDRSFSHAELYESCRGLAGELAAAGLAAGDRIAVLAPNRAETLQLLGAAALLGATLMMLNTRASAAETAAVLADAAPRLLVVHTSLDTLLTQVPAQLTRWTIADAGGFQPLRAPSTAATGPAWPVVPSSTPLVGIPTAAVDGRARIALLSHGALMHQALLLGQTWSLTADDRHLGLLPLFHMAGLGLTLAGQLAGGATVLLERFDAAAAAHAIETWQASYFASFAPLLGSILDACEADPPRLASLRAVTGLEPPETIARFERRCPQGRFWAGYGQTETAGLVCLAPAGERPGSAGRALPSVLLRIARADGAAAAPNETGEITLRAPCVFSGYWQQPDASAHAARDGWHHTGDLGRLDAQGFLWFAGRAPDKALIKSGGENIYPAEVEQALLMHPALQAAVVFGVPDARWGEAVRAVCVCRPGQTVDAHALAEFVATRIARFKRPRDVLFVETLPVREGGGWDRAAVAAAHGG